MLFQMKNDRLSLLQNLSNNQLHLEGAHTISKMLLDNYYIKSLKLSGDQLRLFLYAHHSNKMEIKRISELFFWISN